MNKPNELGMSHGQYLEYKEKFGDCRLNASESEYLAVYRAAQTSLRRYPENMKIKIVIDQKSRNFSFLYNGIIYSKDEMDRLLQQKAFL